jgi:hypothetical protein
MVATDVAVGSTRSWWNGHSAVTSLTASLLVVGASGLIFDELTAQRRRKERALSVGVQAVIVYAQVRRAYDTVRTWTRSSSGARLDEVRALAAMLLSASPALFDDPAARCFLEQVQRLTGLMFRLGSVNDERGICAGYNELAGEITVLERFFAPLIARLPPAFRAPLTSDRAYGR